MGVSITSLIPRLPLAAFFVAVEKCTAVKKAARGGLGTRLSITGELISDVVGMDITIIAGICTLLKMKLWR